MDNQKWQWAKKQVSGRPADYAAVIRDAKKANPSSVDIMNKEKGDVINVDLGKVAGYPLELSVRDHKTKGIIEARYYLWDHEKATVYVRDLLNPSELA